MYKYLFSFWLILSSLLCAAQTVDERIAATMNSSNWFALDSIYSQAPVDSINPFLEVFSRALVGNRLNRPDVSVPAFEELLENYSEALDLGNLLNSAVMLSIDYSKVGDNAKAASVLTSVLDATARHLDSAAVADMRLYIDRYSALSKYRPYTVSIDGARGVVPFRIAPVGNPEKEAVLMKLDRSSVNGIDADIVFDTGAGVNIISDSLTRSYGLEPLDAYATVMGIGRQKARYAMAGELTLGNITVRDVPFVIVDFEVDNEEANRHMDCLNLVVGSDLMLQLHDLTVDFVRHEITVPKTPPARSAARPDMCFSPSMNLITRGSVHGNPMWICVDTGDASYGSLNGDFFERNREYVLERARPDTLRMAGIGGVHISECFTLPDVSVSLGGASVLVPEITVTRGLNPLAADYECNLGLKSLMRFASLRFNLVDLTLTATPPSLAAALPPADRQPGFEYTPAGGPSFLQTLGRVGMSVANGLLNANAPAAPDL